MSHLEVFLNFFKNFYIFNLNLNFEFGPVPGRTGLTGMRRRRNHACVRQSHLLAATSSLGTGGLVLIPHRACRERVLVLLVALMVCYWTKAVAFSPKYSN